MEQMTFEQARIRELEGSLNLATANAQLVIAQLQEENDRQRAVVEAARDEQDARNLLAEHEVKYECDRGTCPTWKAYTELHNSAKFRLARALSNLNVKVV